LHLTRGDYRIKEEWQMITPAVPDRFTTLPDEHALQTTVVALARIPEGSSVMTNTSVTLGRK
jgi:hypothetical protein